MNDIDDKILLNREFRYCGNFQLDETFSPARFVVVVGSEEIVYFHVYS